MWRAILAILRRDAVFIQPDDATHPHITGRAGFVSQNAKFSASDGGKLRIIGDPEERLDQLEAVVNGLLSTVTTIRGAIDQTRVELDALRASVAEQATAIRSEAGARIDKLDGQHAELSERFEKDQQESEKLDTRGFPLAAVGAALAAFPGAWLVEIGTDRSATPSWLWWLLLVAVVVAVMIGLVWLKQDWSKVQAGWSAALAGRSSRPPAGAVQ